MNITRQPFGTADGIPVELFTLSNDRGLSTAITNYGGRIVTLFAPDRAGVPADIVLGFDSLDGYVARNPFFGALVGRVANRTGRARFGLNGVEYALTPGDGGNHLHGGAKGFDKRAWHARTVQRPGAVGLVLTYLSADGEEGYPGNLLSTVTYTLTDENALVIDYDAVPDRDTIVSLTNHSYFNLAGAGNGDVLGHELTLDADAITAVHPDSIPTGAIRPVAGTPFDFRRPRRIGDRIDEMSDEMIRIGGGYDHNYVLKTGGRQVRIGEVYEPASGRRMEVFTDTPGVQLYTGNKLGQAYPITGKGGKPYARLAGLCLETQHFPNAANEPSFPSPVVRSGERYRQTTSWVFSAV